MVDAIGG